jgi:hypothetical protein
MKRFSNLILCATLACGTLAAQAGTTLQAADLPRIGNGGTGFIGVTESAGMPRQPVDVRWSATSSSAVPTRAGEASTFVEGRPNAQPDVPMAGDRRAMNAPMQGDARTMGMAGSSMPAIAVHPGWGTPK